MTDKPRMVLGSVEVAERDSEREEVNCGHCGLIYQQQVAVPRAGRVWHSVCPRCGRMESEPEGKEAR